MTKDDGRHKEIREEVIGYLNQLESLKKRKILSSHEEGGGDITLFFKEKPISQPDIVVLEDNKVSAMIEIELSSQPKHLIGVAIANSLAESGKFTGNSFEIDTFDLCIIVDSRPIEKDGSSKPDQIKAIESGVKKIFREIAQQQEKVSSFHLITDKEFRGVIWKD